MNLHIFLSSIESETRLFKETQYTIHNGIFERVCVCGLWSKGLKVNDMLDWGLEICRKKTILNKYQDNLFASKISILRKIVALLSLVQYALFVLKKALKFKPSHITCHNVILLPLSWLAAKCSGAILIYAPHELETERTHLGGFQKRIEKIIEKVFIVSCEEVVVVCNPIAKWYKEKYKLNNIWTIRNVPKKEDLSKKTSDSDILRNIFKIPSNSLVIIYQGIFGIARGTSDLLQIFSSLENHDIHLVMMGTGEESDIQEIKSCEEKFGNIHYQPAVQMKDIISYTSSADIGIFISNITSLSYRYALPNKFFEYMHGGLPIIVSSNLEHLSEIVKNRNLGWVSHYDDITKTILDIDRTKVKSYQDKTLEYAKDAIWEKDAEHYKNIYIPKLN